MSRLSDNNNDAMELKMTRQSGFTLLEISIVMVIMAAMAAIATRSVFIKLDTRMTEHTAVEVWTIGEYAQNYIQKNGEWPGAANSCNDALTAIETSLGVPHGTLPATSPWETNYITSCDSDSFSISVQTDDKWAPALVNMLAVTRLVGGTTDTTITTLPLPGSIAAFDGLLKRVDTGDVIDNTMEADLYMGGNNLLDANQVEASEFVDADNDSFVLDPNDDSNINTLVVNGILHSESALYATSGMLDDGAGGSHPGYAAAFRGRNGDGDHEWTTEPESFNGSINVNDIMLRSVGHWLSSRLPDMVEKRSFVAYGGDLIPKPDCPAVENSSFPDPEQKIKVHPAEGSYAIDYDADYWEVITNTNESVHADIYCYYPPLNDTLADLVPFGNELQALRDSGDLQVNSVANAYGFHYNVYRLDVTPDGYFPSLYFRRGSWYTPVYAENREVCSGRNCQDMFVESGQISRLTYVNNTYANRQISLDIALNLNVHTDDGVDVAILVNGGTEYSQYYNGFNRTETLSHTITVPSGTSAEVTIQVRMGGGSNTDILEIASSSIDVSMQYP